MVTPTDIGRIPFKNFSGFTELELQEADVLLKDFWDSYKQLYGIDACTPNIHLHGYLTRCIKDFGPVWCFSYERMNGMLGSYQTNIYLLAVNHCTVPES
jgi:hypothetical protein